MVIQIFKIYSNSKKTFIRTNSDCSIAFLLPQYIFLIYSCLQFCKFCPVRNHFWYLLASQNNATKKGFRQSLVILKHHLLQPLQSVILSPVYVNFDYSLTMNLPFSCSLTAYKPLYLYYQALKVGDKVHFHKIWAIDCHKKAELC